MALLALAAGLLALPASPARAATVVASSGPSAAQFRVGMQISATEPITLREGDILTVLDGAGTRVLRGPGTFVLARQSARASNRALAALTTQRSATRARTGAVRAANDGQPPANPSLWYVDVSRSGTICLANPAALRLWRADTTSAARYTIRSGERLIGEARFAEREMLARWPSGETPAEGATYRIIGPQGAVAEVRLVLLPSVPDEPEALARILIERDCMVQVAQMANALAGG